MYRSLVGRVAESREVCFDDGRRVIGHPRALLHRFTAAGRVRRRNARYDELTMQIIRRVLGTTSNAVDVGCFRGKILDEIVRQAPDGHHVAVRAQS